MKRFVWFQTRSTKNIIHITITTHTHTHTLTLTLTLNLFPKFRNQNQTSRYHSDPSLNYMAKSLLLSLVFLFLTLSFAQEKSLSSCALLLTEQRVTYDPSYFSIPYPNGDVPADKGVCTDVVIRAYRMMGIDLQKEVHEDMQANFSFYPKIWGLKKTDTNIDHRRVPNLMVFFKRKGKELPITKNPKDYKPNDIVCWKISGSQTHIGIVVNRKSADGKRYKIVHNIGSDQVCEDMLFDYTIIGHYAYEK